MEEAKEYRYSRGRSNAYYVLFLCIPFIILLISNRPRTASTNIHPNPIIVALYWLFFALVVALFLIQLGFARYLWLVGKNEKITTYKGVVTWIDYKGSPQLQTELDVIDPGQLQKKMKSQTVAVYRLPTPNGELKWSGDIDNCDDLLRTLGVNS